MTRRLDTCFLLAATALSLAVAGAGCTTTASTESLVRTVKITAALTSNSGRPFYVIVRSVTEAQFLKDSYTTVARTAFPKGKDESTHVVQFVFPGSEQEVSLEAKSDQPLGIYALFTDPGDPWKVFLPAPLAGHYAVQLNDATVRLVPLAEPPAKDGSSQPPKKTR